MNERDFESLMFAIHGKKEPDWEARLQECKRILEELWRGEFREIEAERIVVKIVPHEKISALAAMMEKPSGRFTIFVSRKVWEGSKKERLRELMRHEMLHVSTGLGHEDPRFDIELQRIKAFPWDNIYDY